MKVFLKGISSTARQSRQLNREADNFSSPLTSVSSRLAGSLFTSGSPLIPPVMDFEFLSSFYIKTCSSLTPFLDLFYSSVLSSTTGSTKIGSLKALKGITATKSIYRTVVLHCGFQNTVGCVESEIK